jgi:hypothetical protein
MVNKDARIEAAKRAEGNSAWALLGYAVDGKMVDWNPIFGDVREDF